MPRKPLPRRLRSPVLRSSTRVDSAEPRRTQLDVWLTRLSHLSQFALLLATAAGFYFTVLPLYQKALLDEAIARREIELKQATESLNAAREEAYVLARASAVKDYAIRASWKCSGIAAMGEAESASDPSRPDAGTRTLSRHFEIDVGVCLAQELESARGFRELRLADREFFAQQIQLLVADLQSERFEAMAAFESVPKRGRDNPESLPPPGRYMGRMLDFLEGKRPPGEVAERRLAARISAEQSRVAMSYVRLVSDRVLQLQSIAWPNAGTK